MCAPVGERVPERNSQGDWKRVRKRKTRKLVVVVGGGVVS